jgi:hypothetical protein
MAVAFFGHIEASPFLTKKGMELLKQGIWFLLLFFLCLDIGCLLLLPFGPPFRQSDIIFRQWLLPLAFAWWGIVTPVLGYWLFQQFLSCWQSRTSSCQMATKAPIPLVWHLSLADLEIRRRRSRDREQRRHYQTLALASRGYTIEKIAALIGVDEESIAALLLSYNTWGPHVLRTRSRRLAQPIAQLLRHDTYRQKALKASQVACRSEGTSEMNNVPEFQATG